MLSDGTDTYLYGVGRIGEYSEPLLQETWLYYLPGALGSVRQLADADGVITFAGAYEAYGETMEAFGATRSSYGFAGEWTDAVELLYLRARYYQPATGRFIQPDPFEGIASLPATLHPYQYAFNNPVQYSNDAAWIVFAVIAPGLLLVWFLQEGKRNRTENAIV